MRIALVTDSYYATNGVSHTYRRFADFCASKQYYLEIFTPEAGNHRGIVKLSDYVTLHHLPIRWPFKYDKELPPFDLKLPVAFFKKQLSQNFDVVHIATPAALGIAAKLACQKMPIAKVFAFHTDLAQYAFLRVQNSKLLMVKKTLAKLGANFVWWLLGWFYKFADCIVVPSEATRDLLPWKKNIEMFSRGVDTKKFNPCHKDNSLKSKKPIALYVGRLVPEKNLQLLVEVFSKKTEVELWLVGDGSLRRNLEAQLPDARFFGKLENEALSRVYASADFFVFPSTTDTFGNVVLEALASGLPSIVTSLGGPSKIVKHQKTGLVVNAIAKDFSSAVDQLTKNTNLRQEMSAAATAQAASYHWDKAFFGLISIYENCCKNLNVPASSYSEEQTGTK